MARRKRKLTAEIAEIDVVSYIDIMLVLLVVFQVGLPASARPLNIHSSQ